MRKPAPSREIPPPLELECLKALWKLGEGNVKDVQGELKTSGRELAYTTVMTLLDRLTRKGAAARQKTGRAFAYTPVLTRGTLLGLAVRGLVDTLFNGSEEELAAYLQNGAVREIAVREQEPEQAVEVAAGELDAALL
ncbi:MAG: BlaI/MecI/CopY family transcriptional regulator [Bryobacteraceae bacterium]